MNNTKPIITESFTYAGILYTMEFYEITDKSSIPDLPWSQVYAIGNYRGQVPIVRYENHRDNLPGGGVEEGESLDDALRREVREELNMSVVEWEPLGYQVNRSSDGSEISYQFRTYARLRKDGEFSQDTGGLVIGYDLSPIKDLNNRIGWGKLGDWLENKLTERYR